MSGFQKLLSQEARHDSDPVKRQKDFLNIVSIQEMYEKVQEHYLNPDTVIRLIESLDIQRAGFFYKNPDFILLDSERKAKLIELSVNKIIVDSFLIDNPNLRTAVGQCGDQLASDKQNCFRYALVAGAVCGLTVPTLLGAVACYSGVMAADIVCHTQAEDNYAICMQYKS